MEKLRYSINIHEYDIVEESSDDIYSVQDNITDTMRELGFNDDAGEIIDKYNAGYYDDSDDGVVENEFNNMYLFEENRHIEEQHTEPRKTDKHDEQFTSTMTIIMEQEIQKRVSEIEDKFQAKLNGIFAYIDKMVEIKVEEEVNKRMNEIQQNNISYSSEDSRSSNDIGEQSNIPDIVEHVGKKKRGRKPKLKVYKEPVIQNMQDNEQKRDNTVNEDKIMLIQDKKKYNNECRDYVYNAPDPTYEAKLSYAMTLRLHNVYEKAKAVKIIKISNINELYNSMLYCIRLEKFNINPPEEHLQITWSIVSEFYKSIAEVYGNGSMQMIKSDDINTNVKILLQHDKIFSKLLELSHRYGEDINRVTNTNTGEILKSKYAELVCDKCIATGDNIRCNHVGNTFLVKPKGKRITLYINFINKYLAQWCGNELVSGEQNEYIEDSCVSPYMRQKSYMRYTFRHPLGNEFLRLWDEMHIQ